MALIIRSILKFVLFYTLVTLLITEMDAFRCGKRAYRRQSKLDWDFAGFNTCGQTTSRKCVCEQPLPSIHDSPDCPTGQRSKYPGRPNDPNCPFFLCCSGFTLGGADVSNLDDITEYNPELVLSWCRNETTCGAISSTCDTVNTNYKFWATADSIRDGTAYFKKWDRLSTDPPKIHSCYCQSPSLATGP